MTVRELINELEELVDNYGEDIEDREVVIAEYQNYGTDWAYNISKIDEGIYSDWVGRTPYKEEKCDEPNCVKIVLGRQIGTMKDEW